MKILGGIVLYKPDLIRLHDNIDAVINQVDELVVFTNGNETERQVEELQGKYPGLVMMGAEDNKGIAYALREIMNYAIKHSFDWVLTLDQDSVCYSELVSEYKKYVNLPNTGMLSCNIVDRNFKQDNGFKKGEDYKEIGFCITAGAFTNVKAYKQTDGYDVWMFIDGVDWDICYNLRHHGFRIYKINYDGILQEVGHGKNVKLFKKPYITYFESPLRNYYLSRNCIYLAKKYPEYISMGKTLIREIRAEVLILLYEDQKWKKIKMKWKGTFEGIKSAPNRNN